MKRIIHLPFLLSYAFAAILLCAAANLGSPFQVVWEDAFNVQQGGHFNTQITIRVPEGHYLYADKTDIDFRSLEGVRIDEIKFPKAVSREDLYFGKSMQVYTGDVVIKITGHVPQTLEGGERELVALLSFQGCSPKLCLRPEEREVSFGINIVPGGDLGRELPVEQGQHVVAEAGGLKNLLRSPDFADILGRGAFFSILIVFLAGLLISFTPCIWPIIPIILLIVGVDAQKKWWRNTALSATFVIGLVLVNACLGITAVALGKGVGFLFQNRIFLLLVVLFFIVMALSMFGLFEFNPLKVFQEKLHRLGGRGFRGALLMGMATGLIASPCASPVLAALLAYVALQKSYLMGFVLLNVFGLGMGILFIIFGAVYGTFVGRFKGTSWAIWAKRALGIILLIPALFYLKSFVRWEILPRPSSDAPHVEWINSHDEGLKFARQSGRPVMIEFYSDWCPPCKTLDLSFFKRDDIVQLSYLLVPIRIDVTSWTPQLEEVIADYHVVGWPTFYFLSPDGKLYDDLTTISCDTAKLEAAMRNAIARTK